MTNCENCFNNCADKQTTDRCVMYTGADIPLLGICGGDTLYQVEVAIIEALTTAVDGTGITLEELTLESCPALETIFGTEEKNLVTILQMLIDYQCTLKALIDGLTPAPISFDTACLTGLPANPCATDILQAVVNKICTLSTDVAAIPSTYVRSSDLCAAVATCLSNTSTQEYTKMPKYVALPYLGPLSVFDSTGKGLEAFGYDKVYICNGNNSTQDLRGRAVVGANTNVVGPTLDAAVDPSLPANAGYNIAQNTKKGTYTHILTATEIPSHTHGVNDPGHTHTYEKLVDSSHPGGSNQTDRRNPSTAATGSSTTGITINSAGGDQPHNNLQPSFGAVWIIYLPS